MSSLPRRHRAATASSANLPMTRSCRSTLQADRHRSPWLMDAAGPGSPTRSRLTRNAEPKTTHLMQSVERSCEHSLVVTKPRRPLCFSTRTPTTRCVHGRVTRLPTGDDGKGPKHETAWDTPTTRPDACLRLVRSTHRPASHRSTAEVVLAGLPPPGLGTAARRSFRTGGHRGRRPHR
jgi:hypothetical protein